MCVVHFIDDTVLCVEMSSKEFMDKYLVVTCKGIKGPVYVIKRTIKYVCDYEEVQ